MKTLRLAYILPLLLIFFSTNLLFAARTELISKSTSGGSANGESKDPSISSNSRFIVFESTARNLVDDKTSSQSDIFFYDRNTRNLSRISLTPTDTEANGSSRNAEISADGNVISFMSQATNLIDDDTEGQQDIFVFDRDDNAITRVSVSSNGTAADGSSDSPDVSSDGRYIVFHSSATNLVSDDTNGQIDIFRHDRQTGNTVRVNFDFLDEEAENRDSYDPVISDDGRYVAFETEAVLTPCDDNGDEDIYVRDMENNSTFLASVTYYGCVANNRSHHPSISGDGRFVSFSSHASNLVLSNPDTNNRQDVYIRDLDNETTERISLSSNSGQGDERSVGYGGNISSNGRYVVFSSEATNFVNDDYNDNFDVFARDRTNMATSRESVGHYWEEGQGDSTANVAVISADGRYIVFDSRSSLLVAGDSNNNWDIFIRDYLWPGPLVTDINPHSGDFHGGTLLTISGLNFQSGAAVTIDGVPAINVVVNSNSMTITCITPPHVVSSVEVQVTNPDGNSWIFPVGHGFTGYIYRPLAFPWMGILLRD